MSSPSALPGRVPRARGRFIVGTHRLVVEPSREPTPSLAWLQVTISFRT